MKWYAKYVGLPFKALGRDHTGCDCYGLVRLCLNEQYNISLPSFSIYDDPDDRVEIQNIISDQIPLLEAEEMHELKEGAVVIMASHGLEAHVGLLVEDNLVLHTTRGTGCIIQPVDSINIKNKIRGIYNVSKSHITK